jgi:hypothetical protein
MVTHHTFLTCKFESSADVQICRCMYFMCASSSDCINCPIDVLSGDTPFGYMVLVVPIEFAC